MTKYPISQQDRAATQWRDVVGIHRRRMMDALIWPGNEPHVRFKAKNRVDSTAAAELASRPHWRLEVVKIRRDRNGNDRALRRIDP